MHKAIEDEINNCIACQSIGWPTPPAKIQSSLLPNEVWDTLNIDFLGLLPNEKYVLLLWINNLDFYLLLLPLVLQQITSVFHVIFGQYGYLRKIISDTTV